MKKKLFLFSFAFASLLGANAQKTLKTIQTE
jgi:hypothetical protein